MDPEAPDVGAKLGAKLGDLLRQRIARLEPAPRMMLEMLGVAGRPVPRVSLERACGGGAAAHATLMLLRAARLARLRPQGGGDLVEVHHEQIRHFVLRAADPGSLRACHRALALALQATEAADPETLAEHYGAAGDVLTAARFAELAGDRAAQALAFDRAAQMYRSALDLFVPIGERRLDLLRRLGDALANAGRGADAAAAYLRAAEDARPADRVALRRVAAEQFLVNGHVEHGIELLGRVLSDLGMRLPRTRPGALAALAAARMQLRRLGPNLGDNELCARADEQLSSGDLARLDACWSAAVGLAPVDPLLASVFAARLCVLALKVGEPCRIARGLACEAGLLAATGKRGRDRAVGLLEVAGRIADRIDDEHARAIATHARGLVACHAGSWREAYDCYRRAAQTFRNRWTGVMFENTWARVGVIAPLYYLGELGEISVQMPELLAMGQACGNLFLTVRSKSGHGNIHWLAADDVEGARAAAAHARFLWPQSGVQHDYYDLLAQGQIDLYRSDGARALERVAGALPSLRYSGVLRLQRARVETLHLQARAAVMSALADGATGPEPRELCALAARNADRIDRELMVWSSALARSVRASVALARGDQEAAVGWLRAAETSFRECEMALFAAACERLRGQLIGGRTGRALVEGADQQLFGQGVAKPAGMARMLVPGPPVS